MNDFSDDINFASTSSDDVDRQFNLVIGYIEDVMMNEKFVEVHKNFLEQYYMEFDNCEENKLEYMDIFNAYNEVVEKFIENELSKKLPNFNMNDFEKELINRQNELDGEIFEMLSTFTDFLEFKAMFLDYKAMKEGTTVDFSKDLLVTKYEIDTYC